MLRIKARGQRELITVVGHAATVTADEFVQISGAWVNDRVNGQQFRASFFKATPPTMLEGIERYLASGLVFDTPLSPLPGIGQAVLSYP